jgi:hypothetical protein
MLNIGARWGWWTMPRSGPFTSGERSPFSIVQEGGWSRLYGYREEKTPWAHRDSNPGPFRSVIVLSVWQKPFILKESIFTPHSRPDFSTGISLQIFQLAFLWVVHNPVYTFCPTYPTGWFKPKITIYKFHHCFGFSSLRLLFYHIRPSILSRLCLSFTLRSKFAPSRTKATFLYALVSVFLYITGMEGKSRCKQNSRRKILEKQN